jgi:hypothetical protein
MSRIFWYYLCTVWYTILFITCSSRRSLDVSLIEKIQNYREEDLEQQQAGSKASDP